MSHGHAEGDAPAAVPVMAINSTTRLGELLDHVVIEHASGHGNALESTFKFSTPNCVYAVHLHLCVTASTQ